MRLSCSSSFCCLVNRIQPSYSDQVWDLQPSFPWTKSISLLWALSMLCTASLQHMPTLQLLPCLCDYCVMITSMSASLLTSKLCEGLVLQRWACNMISPQIFIEWRSEQINEWLNRSYQFISEAAGLARTRPHHG